MALIPFFDEDLFGSVRPSRLLDQAFGVALHDDDFLAPCLKLASPRHGRRLGRMLLTAPYDRHWRSHASTRDRGSTVSTDKNKFQVSLDVQQFSPEEITVKATGDDTITVEGKHEERQDEHGFISRHFVRKYTLPKGHDIEKVQSKLSSDGVLTITAPKEGEKKGEREIPIALTGQPSAQRAVENGGGDEDVEKGEKEKKETRRKK